jgi:hypothetical protein
MTCDGLIVNCFQALGLEGYTVDALTELLSTELGAKLAAKVAGNLEDFDVLARRDRASVEQLSNALGESNPLLVPRLDGDVQDLGGLAVIAEHLFA